MGRSLAARVTTFVVLSLVLYAGLVSSLYANQAGVFDWHHQYIGTPRSSFFHKFVSRGAYVLIASDRNVLASINVRSGNIDWRQVFDENENILAFKGYESTAISVSKRDNDYIIRSWESHSGFMLWENRIKYARADYNFNQVIEDDAREAGVIFAANNLGVLVLLEGSAVVNLNVTDGSQIWRSDLADSSTIIYKLVDFKQKVYGVGLKRSFSSYTIEVITYDISHGTLKTHSLNSKVVSIKDVIVLGGNVQGGFVVWREGGFVRVNRLGTNVIEQSSLEELYGNVIPSFANAKGELELLDLNLGSRTEFLFQVSTKKGGSTAAVFKVDPENGQLVAIYDLEEKSENSIYSATFDKNDRLIISRSRIVAEGIAKVDIIAPGSELILGNYEIPYSLNSYGNLKKSLLDVDSKATGYRMLVTSADGSMHFWKDHNVIWKSEESLAYTIEAKFLDLPESKLWTQEVDELAEQPEETHTTSPIIRYFRRIKTHIEQLRDFPDYLIAYARRFITGDYEAEKLNSKSKTSLHRDTLGFRKLLIFVTPTKLVALDTTNKGQVIWSQYFGNDVFEFNKIIIVRSSTVKYPPLIVAIGMQKDSEGKIFTRLFRLNALTGEKFIATENAKYFPPEVSIPITTKRILRLPVEEPDERTRIIALIDDELKLHIYPNHENAIKSFIRFAPSFYFTLSDDIEGKFLKGYNVVKNTVQPFNISEIWTLDFPKDEKIAAIGHIPQNGKIASLGRVLGDRSVLYKYLNPHLIAIATLTSSSTATTATTVLNIYLIDTVKGSILHHAIHENVGPSHPVRIAQIENSVVYHFWSESNTEKGYMVVVYELYESENKDQRYESPVFSSFAHERPYVSSQAYMFPYGVNAIGVTNTKHGIATREFLFALDTDQVFGVSKRFLDPRRPQRALTNEDKEEMLIPYDSSIPDNKKWVLSYHLSVAGIKKIITSPALLESTSLVLAYGLDLWFTREAPSKTFDLLNEDFSKGTLLATIFGLILGILITKPMVRRKKVNARWY